MKQNKLMDVLTGNKLLASMLFVLGCGWNGLQAQVQNNGILHVAANSYLYVNNGDVSFGSSSATTTNVTSPYSATDGRIILGSTSSFSTDGTAPKFVTGYAETRNTTETLLAIGAGTTYAPIKVTSSAGTGVHGAYINAAPLTTYAGGLDLSVTAVANTEYWMIKGADAIVTLSWRASSALSSYPYPDVTIVGYKNGKWEAIPSAIDATSEFSGTSALNATGSVTSSSTVALSTYDALAIGRKTVLLGNDNFNTNFTSTTLNDKVLKVNSKVTIDEVKVFDMTGRLVLNVAAENNAISFAADFNHAVGVYIVKVKLTNGQIITSKLINK